MNNWDPLAYGQFDAERIVLHRPVGADTARAAPPHRGPWLRRRPLDAGLADRYPDSDLVGVDTSTQMLAAARARLPGVGFLEGDAANWKAAPTSSSQMRCFIGFRTISAS